MKQGGEDALEKDKFSERRTLVQEAPDAFGA
jgi:hypothetical protein